MDFYFEQMDRQTCKVKINIYRLLLHRDGRHIRARVGQPGREGDVGVSLRPRPRRHLQHEVVQGRSGDLQIRSNRSARIQVL